MKKTLLLSLLFFSTFALFAAQNASTILPQIANITSIITPKKTPAKNRFQKWWHSSRLVKKIDTYFAGDMDKSPEKLTNQALTYAIIGGVFFWFFGFIFSIVALVKANRALKLLADYPPDHPTVRKAKIVRAVAIASLAVPVVLYSAVLLINALMRNF